MASRLKGKQAKKKSAALTRHRKRGRPAAKTPPKRPKGKHLDFTALKGKDSLENLLKAHITPAVLDDLLVDEATFRRYVEETRSRLGGGRSTVDQLVGTFLEVVGEKHPVVADVRDELVEVNLGHAVWTAMNDPGSFVRAGTADLPALARPAGDIEFHWKDGKPPPKSLPEPPADVVRDPARLSEWQDAQVSWLRSRMDAGSVKPVRDLMIGNSEFCDRAVLLKLKNGHWLLLLSEEYKTAGSGDIAPQSAGRDNRLFNADIDGQASLSFRNPDGSTGQCFLANLVINRVSSTSDRVGIKAGRSDWLSTRIQRVTKGVKEKKAKYGEKVRLGAQADTIFFLLRLQYPGREIRNFFEAVSRGLPR
jgi:hypothetical protein